MPASEINLGSADSSAVLGSIVAVGWAAIIATTVSTMVMPTIVVPAPVIATTAIMVGYGVSYRACGHHSGYRHGRIDRLHRPAIGIIGGHTAHIDQGGDQQRGQRDPTEHAGKSGCILHAGIDVRAEDLFKGNIEWKSRMKNRASSSHGSYNSHRSYSSHPPVGFRMPLSPRLAWRFF